MRVERWIRVWIRVIMKDYKNRNEEKGEIEHEVLERNARWRRTLEGMRVHKYMGT